MLTGLISTLGFCCFGLFRTRCSVPALLGPMNQGNKLEPFGFGASGVWALPLGADSLTDMDLKIPGAVSASGY